METKARALAEKYGRDWNDMGAYERESYMDAVREREQLVHDIFNFLDNRADADCVGDPARYIPNEAMSLQVRMKEVFRTELAQC